tara:strand:+ start:2264 stop:3100 length:837 start_codon:yes stop_codon:yes gene_type:complete
MAKQTINIGSSANDGSGDPLRTAFDKVNDNFGELYAVSGAGSGQNIAISGQKIISENTNGNIQLDPNGTGEVQFLSDTTMGDSFKHQMGDGDDFKIYHDGNHSYISDEGTGNLKIQGSQIDILGGADGAETMATFVDNGAVTLYYDNSAKMSTVTAGIDITGDLNVDTINTGGQALSISASTTTFTSDVTVQSGNNLEAGFIRVDSNLILNGNKISTSLSNSDIDLEPAGTATVNLRVPEQTTVGSAGGAAAVPASPTKYIKIKLNGTEYVIPAFAVS